MIGQRIRFFKTECVHERLSVSYETGGLICEMLKGLTIENEPDKIPSNPGPFVSGILNAYQEKRADHASFSFNRHGPPGRSRFCE